VDLLVLVRLAHPAQAATVVLELLLLLMDRQ
jgi:hypothetical protein